MSRVVLPSKRVSGVARLLFDFAPQLGVGETISSKTATAAVFSGVTPDPSAPTIPSPSSSGTLVYPIVSGGSQGTIYDILVTVTTSFGQTLTMSGYLAILPDAS